MESLKLLTNEKLLETYETALKLSLSIDFIELLVDEIERRNLISFPRQKMK